MRNRSLSPRYGSSDASKRKSNSRSQSASRRPMSSAGLQGTYDKLLKTSFIISRIRKTIKQNDLRHLIGEERQKLRTEPAGDREWAEKVSHQALIDIRRRYDAVKRQRITKLQQTEKLKERLKTYSFEELQWKEKIRNCHQYSEESQIFMKQDRTQNQFKFTDKKVMQHMSRRLKEDIEYYKAKTIIGKRKLLNCQQSIRSLFTQSQKLSTQTANSTALLGKLTAKLEEQAREREQHISNLKELIKNRDLKEQNEQERLQYESEQAEKALLAKSEEEQSWRLLLLSHLVVRRILLNKMRREMDKFEAVEHSFKTIISKTQIKDANELVDRFLRRDENYSRLLGEVAKAKNRHCLLKQEQAILLMENQRLEQQSMELLNLQYAQAPSKGIVFDNRDRFDAARSTEVPGQEIPCMEFRLKEWLLRQILKISRLDHFRYEFSHQLRQEGNKALFCKFLEYLSDASTNCDRPIEDQGLLREWSLENENKSFISTHSKTYYGTEAKNAKQVVPFQNESILNMRAANKEREEQDQYKMDEEAVALDIQRQQILQGNLRFMRDLRSKFRDCRQKKT